MLNFGEPRTGEVQYSPAPEVAVPSAEAREKPGRSWRGKDSERTRLDDRWDCSIRADQSTYAKWRIFVCQVATSRVLQRGKIRARSKRTGEGRGQGSQRARPGRRGKSRPDYALPDIAPWP